MDANRLRHLAAEVDREHRAAMGDVRAELGRTLDRRALVRRLGGFAVTVAGVSVAIPVLASAAGAQQSTTTVAARHESAPLPRASPPPAPPPPRRRGGDDHHHAAAEQAADHRPRLPVVRPVAGAGGSAGLRHRAGQQPAQRQGRPRSRWPSRTTTVTTPRPSPGWPARRRRAWPTNRSWPRSARSSRRRPPKRRSWRRRSVWRTWRRPPTPPVWLSSSGPIPAYLVSSILPIEARHAVVLGQALDLNLDDYSPVFETTDDAVTIEQYPIVER